MRAPQPPPRPRARRDSLVRAAALLLPPPCGAGGRCHRPRVARRVLVLPTPTIQYCSKKEAWL